MIYTNKFSSPIGNITMSGTDEYLIGLWFDGQKYFGDTLPKYCENRNMAIFNETKRQLSAYFGGKNPHFDIPIHFEATPFRETVWNILSEIPYGKTITYGQIAKLISPKMSAQAVGNAVGHNPISIIVPCHRVLGANGKLTGYAGGIDKKLALLRLEKILH